MVRCCTIEAKTHRLQLISIPLKLANYSDDKLSALTGIMYNYSLASRES